MTVDEIAESMGICGLVCSMCSYRTSCAGCRCKDEDCSIKKCCVEKGLDYCFQCPEFPCEEGMFNSIRIRAFNKVAREEGLIKLAEYLERNMHNGIWYHRNDGIKGDYDRLQNEMEVLSLLKNGRLYPYEACPTYESGSFLLRLISMEDAEALRKCYSNSQAQQFFNNDNCCFGYDDADTLEKMEYNIKLWLNSYNSRNFVRFSIIDKSKDAVVGTIEIFGGSHGVLRIDILPEYETEACLIELLQLADRFFLDFECKRIVSKAVPQAAERIKALKACNYLPYPKNDTWSREYYYMKPGK